MNTKVFCSDAERVYFGIRSKHLFFGEWKHRRKQETPKFTIRAENWERFCRNVTPQSFLFSFEVDFWSFKATSFDCYDKSGERIKSKSDQTSSLCHILPRTRWDLSNESNIVAISLLRISKINFESLLVESICTTFSHPTDACLRTDIPRLILSSFEQFSNFQSIFLRFMLVE